MGGIDVIDPRYRVLLERANKVLGGDHRVRSVTVGGSVGAGTADQWSDLDLDWPAGLARVAAARIRDELGIETADWLY
jgi:hypothetical protein